MNFKPNYKKTKGELMLPRGYLSWSAMQTFKRNKEQFIRHYIYGEPHEYNSPSIDFGKTFAEDIEKRKKHADPVMDTMLRSIPKMPRAEYAMDAIIPSKYGKFKVVGKLDQFDPMSGDFDEFKTGFRKWTQNMAQEHGQMKFYAMMVYLKLGITASKKTLVWIETERRENPYTGSPEGIVLTGNVKRFTVGYTLADILTFMDEVSDVAKEISDIYQEEINKTI